MQPMPRTRLHNYGSVPNFTAWQSDSSGSKKLVAKAPAMRSLGNGRDSLLVSSGHPAPFSRSPYNGSDFYKVSYAERSNPASGRHHVEYNRATKSWWLNEGLYFPLNMVKGSSGFSPFGAIRSLMVPMGSVGWNRFRPGKPLASLSQFLGELRQLPKNPFRIAQGLKPVFSRFGANSPQAYDAMRRSVGDQYLNWSFGWKPFLSDLEKIADFDDNLKHAMRQLRRDNGRTIRRGGTIESDTSSTTSGASSSSPSGYMEWPFTSWTAGGSSRTVTITTTWKYWFSAGFVYYLPMENDPNSMARLHQYLRGGGISPSVVWELTPWSWLADYFTNLGDVLENWEASRELALAAKYCYVMYKRTVTTSSVHAGWNTHPTYGSMSLSCSYTSVNELKARTWASPYGFGFTPGSLNTGQTANLMALGLSRRL